jgi:hypothetical protein
LSILLVTSWFSQMQSRYSIEKLPSTKPSGKYLSYYGFVLIPFLLVRVTLEI